MLTGRRVYRGVKYQSNMICFKPTEMVQRLPGAWIAHLDNILPFKCNYNSNEKLSDNFDFMKTLIGLIMRIILSIESFILSVKVFKILTETAKNVIFCHSRAITLIWSRLTNLIPGDFCRPYNKNLFSNERIWLNLTVLEIYAKNCCLIPMFYFNNSGHIFFARSAIPIHRLSNMFYTTFMHIFVSIHPVVLDSRRLSK